MTLVYEGGEEGAHELPLPEGSVAAVMRRYAKPVDENLLDVSMGGEGLSLGDGGRLVRVRFRPHYDVIAKDYLVLCAEGAEPVAELATTVSAALLHLGRAFAESEAKR